ncbi:Y-family DNA polymerase [Pontibacter chitinilyticus]|uniref:Y-family DNA polymerase n=1 Tax=Pontibacter chitinilyticus TaxID=2674989 RepID=UPI00321A07DC
MAKLFALVDCNNFYASCERVFAPKLQHQPIVVLSNNDGCIIARSTEAKALGIAMGEPAFKAKEMLKQNGVHVFSSNYALYGDMSARVMQTLGHFSPHLEVYSIDEAFLDLSHLPLSHVEAHAQQLRTTVQQWTGIPVSVGIAPTKTLAKLANRFSKKNLNSNMEGVLLLQEKELIDEVLQKTKVSQVWGIGRRNASKLELLGIHTAWDLSRASDSFVRKHLTVVGLRTAKELRGESCLELEQVSTVKQHICTSRSFGNPVTDLELLKEATGLYASRCAAKLRRQKSYASAITVYLQAYPHNNGQAYYNSKTLHLPAATNSTLELIHYANVALELLYRRGYRYKKSAVIVAELSQQAQLPLLDTTDREKHQRLMQALDTINSKWGKETVILAAQGVYDEVSYRNKENKKRVNPWEMRKAHRSSRYTTHWEELLCIQV